MQLTGELKEKVEQAENKEEAKKILEDVGITLDDTELDQIAGGKSPGRGFPPGGFPGGGPKPPQSHIA